jgi:hypothetical protein
MQLFGANNLTTPPQSKHILVALMILTLKTNLGGGGFKCGIIWKLTVSAQKKLNSLI